MAKFSEELEPTVDDAIPYRTPSHLAIASARLGYAMAMRNGLTN